MLANYPPGIYIPSVSIDFQGEGKGWKRREDPRMTPGIQPRIERRMLIKKSALQPVLKKTARGGRKMARK
jgi:hypothetical protein